MRAVFVLGATALVAGCATWRAEAPADVRSSAVDRMFVVTKDQALELDGARTDGNEIEGRTTARWTFPPGGFDAQQLEYLQKTNDSPKDVAQKMSWQPAGAMGDPSRVPVADVVVLRKYDPRTGLTAIAVVGGLIGALVLALGIAFIVFVTSGGLSCGRPLRVRGRSVITRLAAPAAESAGWSKPLALAPVPEAAARVLAEVWTIEARAEHAAVAAFSKLSLELIALGAPPDLVTRANRAAIQEVEHARLCFAVASAYAGRALEPAPLPEALAGDTPDLSRLARESLLDGCLREGLASHIAQMGAENARDPAIVHVLRVQAKEEAQHAAFSWSIVEWAVARAGEPLRRRLVAEVDALEFPRCDDLPEHGRVGRAAVQPHYDLIRADARERLAALRSQRSTLSSAIGRRSVMWNRPS